MFSFFKKDQSHKNDCKIPANTKRSSGKHKSDDSSGTSTSNGRRTSLAFLTQSKKISDVLPNQRSINIDVLPVSPPPSSHEVVIHKDLRKTDSSSCHRNSINQRRFIREVVVERRSDDHFDVLIVHDPDGLVAVGPGFFPNDSLVSLNDRNLESMPADKVNRIIRSLAGRTLTVQVLSLYTHETSIDRKHIKRFGTLRARQDCKVTKNIYWLTESDKYFLVQVLEQNKDKTRIRYLNNGGLISDVKSSRLEKANDAEFDMSDDLSTLQFINETSILHVLKTRSKDGYTCCFVGSSILTILAHGESSYGSHENETSLIINSFKEVYLMRPECLPPHYLSPAYNASRNVLRGLSKQSIILFGAYNSEKEKMLRHTLKYLSIAHFQKNTPIQACHWVDNVCTLISLACGTISKDGFDCTAIFKMGIDGKGYACSFSVETLFRNRAKLFYRRIGPSKILSAIAYCDRQHFVRKFFLDEIDLTDNTFLHKTQDREICQLEWRQFLDSLDKINANDYIINFVCAMASVILQLGSCDISKLSGINLEVARDTCWAFPEFDRCAKILQIEKDILLNIIFSKDFERCDDIEITPLRMICGFATACYNFIIEAILLAINMSLDGSVDETKSIISVICMSDISEFQSNPPTTPDLTANYSQLVDNYFNEKLHNAINQYLFDGPQKELQRECVEYKYEPSQLYSFEPMNRLMEEIGPKLGQRGGLLRLLDNPFISHEEVIRRIYAELWRSGDRTISVISNPAIFCVYHLGGNLPVIYDPSDWYAVYKDLPISSRFIDIFDYSERDFIISIRQPLFNANNDKLCPSNVLRLSAKFSSCSTADRIECEMKHVLSIVRSSEIQACYCLTDFQPTSGDIVLRKQIRAFSLKPSCQLYQKALIHKIPNRIFIDRYSCLLSNQIDITQSIQTMVKNILQEVCMNSFAYKVLSSSVFMRRFLAKELEFRLEDIIETTLIRLQSLCRGYVARTRFKNIQLQHRALKCIQRNGRAFLNIRMWAWWKLYTLVNRAFPVNCNRDQELESVIEKQNKRILTMQSEIDDLRSLNEDLGQNVNFYKRITNETRILNESKDEFQNDFQQRLNYNQIMEEKDKEINSLTDKLNANFNECNESQVNEENERLKEKCNEIEIHNSNLQQDICELKEIILITNRKVIELKKEDEIRLSQLTDLKVTISELTNSNSILQHDNDLISAEKERLLLDSQAYNSVETNFEKSVDYNNDSQTFDDRSKNTIKLLHKDIANLEEEINERNEQILSIEQACLKSDLQLQQERKLHLEELNKKEEDFEHFQATYQTRLKLNLEKLDDAENENTRLRKQLRNIESQFDKAKMEEQQNNNFNELVDSLKLKLARYKALLNDARFQLEQANRSDEADLLIKSLRSNVKDLEEENCSLEKSRQTAKLNRDELQAELDEVQRQNTRLKLEMTVLDRDNKSLVERYEEGERESESVLNQLQEKSIALSAYQIDMKTSKATIETLQIENARMKAKIEELESNISNVSKNSVEPVQYNECKVNELEDKLSLEELMKKRLQHQIDRLKEQNMRNIENYSGSCAQVDVLEVQLRDCQSELRQLKCDYELLKTKLKETENNQQILEETDVLRSKDVLNLRSQLKVAVDRLNQLNDFLITRDDIPNQVFLAKNINQSPEEDATRID